MMSRAIDGNSLPYHQPALYDAKKVNIFAETMRCSLILPNLNTVKNTHNNIAFLAVTSPLTPRWLAVDKEAPHQNPLATLNKIKVSLHEAKSKFIQETACENNLSPVAQPDYNAVICEARSELNNINAKLDQLCDVIEHSPDSPLAIDDRIPLSPTIKLTLLLKSISPAA